MPIPCSCSNQGHYTVLEKAYSNFLRFKQQAPGPSQPDFEPCRLVPWVTLTIQHSALADQPGRKATKADNVAYSCNNPLATTLQKSGFNDMTALASTVVACSMCRNGVYGPNRSPGPRMQVSFHFASHSANQCCCMAREWPTGALLYDLTP